MQNIKILTQKIRKLLAFEALFEKDRQTLWLVELMYANKRKRLRYIGSYEEFMHKIKGLNQDPRKI